LKQLFYIKGRTSVELVQPVLSLEVGEHHFSFSITDDDAAQLHYLAYYSADEIDVEALSFIFSEHTELFRSFHSVQVCFDHSRNALVPIRYYKQEALQPMLDLLHGRDGQSAVISENVSEWQLYNVYTVPKEVQEWISRKYPSAVCHHHFTLSIRKLSPGPADRILVDIRHADFSYIAIKDNKLVVAQTLPYSSPEDVSYQLLRTCHQFSLSQQEVLLQVSGLVEKESQLFREMYQLFVNVEFRDTSWAAPDDGEHQLPAHFFTTLNDLARCAS
jgi:hypothetical protein